MHNDNCNYTQVLSQYNKSNMSTEFCLSTNNEKVYKFFKELWLQEQTAGTGTGETTILSYLNSKKSK